MSFAGEGSETAQCSRIDSDHLSQADVLAFNNFHRGIEQHQLGHAVIIAFLKHQTIGGVAGFGIDADDASRLVEEIVFKRHKESGDRHARLYEALAGNRVDAQIKASGLVYAEGIEGFLILGQKPCILAAEQLSGIRKIQQFVHAVMRIQAHQSAFIGSQENTQSVAVVIPHPVGIRGDFHDYS